MKVFKIIVMSCFAMWLLVNCGGSDSDSDDDNGSCHYEKSVSQCGGGNMSAFEAGCTNIDFELRDDLSPAQFCKNAYPATDTECGGGCCLNFAFRNVTHSSDSCP